MAEVYKPSRIAHLLCRVKTYRLMGVVAVLTARTDGSQALGTAINGKVFPAEPYLRDSSVHKTPDSNYVSDEGRPSPSSRSAPPNHRARKRTG